MTNTIRQLQEQLTRLRSEYAACDNFVTARHELQAEIIETEQKIFSLTEEHKMTEASKEKPMIVEITRYYRPYRIDFRLDDRVAEKHIHSDRGVTVMFKLDYNERTFTARFSICNGDNFSKAVGICYAQACPNPIIGEIVPGMKLRDMLLAQISNILEVDPSLQDKTGRRNIELLASEIAESM